MKENFIEHLNEMLEKDEIRLSELKLSHKEIKALALKDEIDLWQIEESHDKWGNPICKIRISDEDYGCTHIVIDWFDQTVEEV